MPIPNSRQASTASQQQRLTNIPTRSASVNCYAQNQSARSNPHLPPRLGCIMIPWLRGGYVVRSRVWLLAALTPSGCAPHLVYLRQDGVFPASDPFSINNFRRTARLPRRHAESKSRRCDVLGRWACRRCRCQQSRSCRGQVAEGCMAEKGYVLVGEDQAGAMSQQLAAVAAEKTRRPRRGGRCCRCTSAAAAACGDKTKAQATSIITAAANGLRTTTAAMSVSGRFPRGLNACRTANCSQRSCRSPSYH